MENHDNNFEENIFICNSQECFNLNQYKASHLRDKTTNPNNKNNEKCTLCSYNFDNIENLRQQIYEENCRNNLAKRNMVKTKIVECLITFGLCLIAFSAAFYFLIQAHWFSK